MLYNIITWGLTEAVKELNMHENTQIEEISPNAMSLKDSVVFIHSKFSITIDICFLERQFKCL